MKTVKRVVLMIIAVLCLSATANVTEQPLVVSVSAATNVRLNKSKVTLYEGKYAQLKVYGTKQKVKWSSSNKNIVSVNSSGKIYGKKKGTATISARVNNKKYNCKVTVKEKPKTYGNVTGNISYYYNRYVGNKPDTGSRVILIPKNGSVKNLNLDLSIYILTRNADNLRKKNIYVSSADGTGNYYFNHIETGNYRMIMISQETTEQKWFDDKKEFQQDIIDYFVPNYLNKKTASSLAKSLIANKYHIEDVSVYQNDTIHVSYDFGITYI